ncbi:prostaglandin F synthase 1-like [Bufo gargarizans]|uniref:prostaglandin F synthase 1-like n=1 Tax=Bufo gargarizans TaxID=30331 RepID=UPI001CF3D1B8|nr:prostaglandin F synthase 1-like [Bufo gargarizans]
MALKADSRITLNDGHKIPVIGFGTYAPPSVPKEQAEASTKVAIEVGYRLIDSASVYKNEAEVGKAIKAKIADKTVKREDIFYIGKLWNNSHAPERVRPALEQSLKNLGLDYMDLFLIHTPMEFKPGDDLFPKDEHGKLIFHHTDIRETWKALEACKDAGLVKSIGVSNFNHKQLEKILHMKGLKYKPVCNEVECHIYHNQSKLREFCKTHDIVVIGYAVLGSSRDENWVEDRDAPKVLEDPVLNTIAKNLKRTPAQVAIRYLMQNKMVVLAKSFNAERIKENFQVFDFELCEKDMKALDGVNKHLRYLRLKSWIEHHEFPFHEEF